MFPGHPLETVRIEYSFEDGTFLTSEAMPRWVAHKELERVVFLGESPRDSRVTGALIRPAVS